MRDTTSEFMQWLADGGRRVGQVLIERVDDHWKLCHVDDAGREDLMLHEEAHAARALANLDESGAYRPLRTAPTLRRGWKLVARSAAELRGAIEEFYPAMLGVWLADKERRLASVPLRETLGRQTGMYRVTQKITEEQAQQAIAQTCNDGSCLKTILWSIDATHSITSLPPEKFAPARGDALPLLCQEPCNILVAATRKLVKGEND
jgi:sirohydrochlorin cobaltochelatase